MPAFKRLPWTVLAILIAISAAMAPASGLELRTLFKGKQFDAHAVSVDTAEAARMLSDYRKRNGLGPVALDPALTRIAADHALRMASANQLAHVVRGEGSFARRLRSGGYDAAIAAENIGGGYFSLEAAFAGWRNSKPHNKNMLTDDITAMGIARADAAGSDYGAYWSLVLARPYKPTPGLPTGPSIVPGGLIRGR